MRLANPTKYINGFGLFAWVTTLTVSFLFFMTEPAFAHHPLDGMPMETFTHGVLSGVGHPVLGFDHLVFIIAAGILAAYSGYALIAPLVLLTGVLAGVVLSVSSVTLPAVEIVIALSLVLLGVIGIRGKSLSLMHAGILFATLGVFHGWAYGAVLVQQEAVSSAVLGGYLLGLSVVQYGVAIAAGYVLTSKLSALKASDLQPRIACAVVTGVGVTFLLEHIEAMILA